MEDSTLPPRAILIILGLLFAAPWAHGETRHPLDALTAEEIEAAVALVEAHDPTDEPRRWPLIHLQEPAKDKVRGWTVGQPVPRAAYVVERRGGKTFAGVVDLVAGRVTDWKELEGSSSLLEDEVSSLTGIVTADPRMSEALAARRVKDTSEVRCLPVTAGGTQKGRQVRALCWDGTGLDNFFSRPLGGLEIVVDLDERRVARFVDHGAEPLSTGNHAYDEATMGTRKRLAPLVQEQPAGANFTLDGGSVRWQTWNFHFRFDSRRGPVISLVHVWDRGRRRSVLYQGSLAEVFVPYRLQADGSWLGWTAAGQGLEPTPLALGLDCPPYATLVDVVVADDRGRPRRVEGAMAIFERRTGDPVWRHYDAFGGHSVESRPAMELVVRTIVRLGTADYLLDWIFTQAGSIRVSVGLTGLLLTEGVATVFLSEPAAAADTASGDFMAANVVASRHEHRLSFRLDLDVDGPVNSLVREDLEPAPPESWRLGLTRRVPHTLLRESEAALSADPAAPGFWRLVGTTRKTDVGQRPGFTLESSSPTSVGGLAGKAGARSLRVTPYDEDELYAPADGGNRPIEATDLVLWHTLAFPHIPRLEDFPVIPTQFRTFELVPFDFFEKNPAIDLRSGFAPTKK